MGFRGQDSPLTALDCIVKSAVSTLAGVSEDVQPKEIRSIAVIGGGTMGAGISVCLLQAGFPVIMVERNDEALQAGIGRVTQTLTRQLEGKRLSQQSYDDCVSRISGTLSYADLGDVDLVIEAVFESLEVKQDVFSKLDAACKPGAIQEEVHKPIAMHRKGKNKEIRR